MKYFVYILISAKRENWSYVGSTSNLRDRFNYHEAGGVKSTKPMRPLELVHFEEYPSRMEAYMRERYLKTGFGREEKNNIIKNKKL